MVYVVEQAVNMWAGTSVCCELQIMHFGKSNLAVLFAFGVRLLFEKQYFVCVGYFLPLGFGNVVLRFLVFQFGVVFLFLLSSCCVFFVVVEQLLPRWRQRRHWRRCCFWRVFKEDLSVVVGVGLQFDCEFLSRLEWTCF